MPPVALRTTLSSNAASSSKRSASFIHGAHQPSMSFTSRLCYKVGSLCRKRPECSEIQRIGVFLLLVEVDPRDSLAEHAK